MIPQFSVIHTVKGFGIVNEAEIDVFLELYCFFDDSSDVGYLICGSYAILFFTASDFAFTTRYIHVWASFPLWLRLFIPSGAVSLLFRSSILDTYQPRGLIFQCHIFLPFHTEKRWNSRPPYLSPEKPIYRARSNIYNWR